MKFDYITEAHRTLSGEFHGDNVGISYFQDTLSNAIAAADDLDVIKKALYYGKFPSCQLGYTIDIPASKLKDEGYSVDLIHGIIGAHTESGELLIALSNAMASEKAKAFDNVNIKEEVGDLLWYLAIIAKACGFTLEDAQHTNIAKLRARYPEKFTEDKAIDRDLSAERQVLESNVDKRLTPEEADALIKEANNEKI